MESASDDRLEPGIDQIISPAGMEDNVDADAKKVEPQGIIAIMTLPTGHVAATHADFERQVYGGFKLWEAQRIRCGDAVKRKAVRVYCSDIVTMHLEAYTLDRMAEDLIQRGKWRVTYRAIGYPEDVADAVDRC